MNLSLPSLLIKCRKDLGLTQRAIADEMRVSVAAVQNWESGRTAVSSKNIEKLSYLFHVPLRTFYEAQKQDRDNSQEDRWPDFLFDNETNELTHLVHLNREQQELFGILYIRNGGDLKKILPDANTLLDDMQMILCEYIKKIGIWNFLNGAEELQKVLRVVKDDFLFKVLRNDPDRDFHLRKLSKDYICEFIDSGYKQDCDDPEETEEPPHFDLGISMAGAKILLPILEKGPLHITDEKWSMPIRDEVPEEIKKLNCRQSDGTYIWNCGLYDKVSTYRNVAEEGQTEKWVLEINDRGRRLLEWFRG